MALLRRAGIFKSFHCATHAKHCNAIAVPIAVPINVQIRIDNFLHSNMPRPGKRHAAPRAALPPHTRGPSPPSPRRPPVAPQPAVASAAGGGLWGGAVGELDEVLVPVGHVGEVVHLVLRLPPRPVTATRIPENYTRIPDSDKSDNGKLDGPGPTARWCRGQARPAPAGGRGIRLTRII